MTEEEQKLNWYAVLESGSMTAVHNLREYIKSLEEQCRDYEEQIEKMTCCDNCKHVEYDWGDYLRIGKCKTCEKLSNWEMKE